MPRTDTPEAAPLAALRPLIEGCMGADRHALERRLRTLEQAARRAPPDVRALALLASDIEASRARRERRRLALPRPRYPEDLPVAARKDDIAAAIAAHPVVIVCGETGSGKTTQLPKICLELGRGVAGQIGHTQPRRVAARSVAARIAAELGRPLGEQVGYQVRFTDRGGADAYVKVMTDGILLAETQGDRFLSRYDTLIIDEAHERSLNIDFLLGYLKGLMPRRPDLKLIVTSATIDAGRFSEHFGGAPVVEVSGRGHPVELRYRPPKEDGDEAPDLADQVLDAIDDIARESASGDVLVFLPGEREIRDCAEALRKHHPKGVEILPLFARLTAEEQDRVFKPGQGRRVVLATNVAETSLTVPNIRFVVDPGLARVNRYSYRQKVEQLLTEKVSRASANQRSGRCGRVSAGVAIRLYAREDFEARPEFSEPELLRSSLAGVILRMKALRLGSPEEFPFLDAPAPRMIADGYQLLTELGAVDEQQELTPVGRQLARLPLDPRIGRMLLAGEKEGALTEVLVVAAALSVQDPRERPFERAQAADERHRLWADERSDFLAYLNLWRWYEEAFRHKKSNRKLEDLCREHFVSPRRIREWRDIHGQLHALTGELGLKENQQPASYEALHRALLAGLLGNIGLKDEAGDYLGARGIRFWMHPGSGLRKKQPRWLVGAELAETTRLFARCVAEVDPRWIEQVAGPLGKKTWHDPWFDEKRAEVMAFERVTVYGLPVVTGRRVAYGRHDPVKSRELFIREGLVAGRYRGKGAFQEANRLLVAEVEELEHKSRRRDVLVDEDAIHAFYDARLPADIVNGTGFEAWRREAEKKDARLLYLSRDDLMRHGADSVTADLFPEAMKIGEHRFPLTYRFEPGHALDGVTLTLPLMLLNQLDPVPGEWLVPGLIREKLAWYFKALPKALRRNVVPVPEHVTALLDWLDGRELPRPRLTEALALYLQRRTGQPTPAEPWGQETPPDHLLVNYRVVDEAGRELASGRDLTALKAKLGQAAQLTFGKAEPGLERDNIVRWDFGDLPGQVSFRRGGQSLTGYPALAEEKDGLAIRLFDTEPAARDAMRAGVRRLLRLELKEHVRQLEKGLPGWTQTALQLRGLVPPDRLLDDVVTAICDRAFIGDDPLPRTEAAFNEQKARARTRLPAVAEGGSRLVAAIAAECHALNPKLAALPQAQSRLARELKEQLRELVYPGFFLATPWERLQHLPRYLKGMGLRMQKYATSVERDSRHGAAIAALWARYAERLEKHRKAGIEDAALAEFRWQIEELRVSLFAQELKTPAPVSVKRLEKLWAGVK